MTQPMQTDPISRRDAKEVIERVRLSISTQQYTEDSPAFAEFKIRAAGIVLDYVAAAIDKVPALSAPPAAERRPAVERQHDEHGQPVCNHCNAKTNRAYAKQVKLQCWSCGCYLPVLTSGDAAQPGE